MRKIVVTGIGTNVGKTFASAILTQALQADYWKPIQAGLLPLTDTEQVKQWISNERSFFHEEAYRLKEPMSPHAAAQQEGLLIDFDTITLPVTTNHLIIEGAGGVLVPLNHTHFVIDLIQKFDAEVVIVIQNYLGCINHSLLTIQALKQRGIKITGLIFNQAPHPSSHTIILSHSGLPLLLEIRQEQVIDAAIVSHYAEYFIQHSLNYFG